MKLFDDLMEASAKLADHAVKVAGETIETSKVMAGEAMDKGKKKVSELSLETDLAKAQKQLGALYYVMRKTGEFNEELLTQYFNDVAEIEEKLEALKLENLNEQNDYSINNVEDEEEENEYDINDFASDVKDAVSEAMEDVKETASNVTEEVIEKVNDFKTKTSTEPTEPTEDVEKSEEIKVCPNCGNEIADTDTFCGTCGAQLK